jgi:hypothetical protein
VTDQDRIWSTWEFWRLVAVNWTAQEQAELNEACSAWMAA